MDVVDSGLLRHKSVRRLEHPLCISIPRLLLKLIAFCLDVYVYTLLDLASWFPQRLIPYLIIASEVGLAYAK